MQPRNALYGFIPICLLMEITLGPQGSSLHAQITESNPGAMTVIHVHVMRPERRQEIPATLFGSFLEPIRQSTYGGLWAEALENPSFEDGLWSATNVAEMLRERPDLREGADVGLPLPWEPLDRSQGSRYAPIRGDAANSYESLLLMSLPHLETGIKQRVYLPVQRELSYHGNIWLKHVDGPDAVKITLRRHERKDLILSSATIHAAALTWTKYSYTLTLKASDTALGDPLDFVISAEDDARVQVDNVSLVPVDAVDGMDPDVLDLARNLHSQNVRFGGNFTSHYDWRDGVGPLDKRVSKLNLSWGIPEYNTFGTDEFLDFCRLIGASPQIALNLGTGTPQDAAAWVRYVDDHWGDRKGGNLWELGNELWGNFQVGYPTEERVAAKTLATSEAVRAVDPNARLIATGADEDGFHDWNSQQLSTPPETFNYLSTHFVVTDRVQLHNPGDDFRTLAALALPWGLGDRIQEIRRGIVDSGRPKVKVAFTEWLMVSESHTGPNFSNLGGAVFAGGFLNMLIRNANAVEISNMTGIMDFAGIVKKHGQAYGAPAYWVLRSYSNSHPKTLLEVESDSPTYSVHQGIERLPEIGNVPYLDVVATQGVDGKSVVLFFVNRNLSRAETAEIDFASLGLDSGTATLTTISSESILDENDDLDPTLISPAVLTENFRSKLTHRFPSHSVTVIQVSGS